MVRLFKALRILFKSLVWGSLIFSLLCAYLYLLKGYIYAAIPLAVFSVMTFIFVLKDHSEDPIRNKARNMATDNEKDLFENVVMLIVYLLTLTLWIISVAASSWLKP